MSSQAAKRLTELCGDHYHGLLTTETYRQQRGELLRAVCDGTFEDSQPIAPQSSPPAAVQFDESSLSDDEDTLRAGVLNELPEADTVAGRTVWQKPVFWVTLVACVALLAAGGFLWIKRGAAPSVTEQEQYAGGLTAPAASVDIAADFLAAADWSEDGIAGFLYELDIMDTAALQNLRKQSSYDSLIRELRERIVEDRALGLGSGGAEFSGMSLLEAFAAELGLDVGQSVAATAPPPEPSASRPAAEVPEVAEPPEPTVAAQPAPGSEAAPADAADVEPAAAVAVAETTAPVATTAAATAAAATEVSDAQQRLRAARERKAEEAATEQMVATNSSDRPCAKLLTTRRRTCWDVLPDGSTGPVMALVQAGSFVMGDDSLPTSAPAHQVTIAQPFALSVWEVSVAEYGKFCQATGRACPDKYFGPDGDLPVAGVTWQDAMDYAAWLSEQTGAAYRLPAEAEWEYAARAGGATRYPNGADLSVYDARFDAGDGPQQPVAKSHQKTERNAYGLWHVAGNLREWTLDDWQENYSNAGADGQAAALAGATAKVVRGGSWSDSAAELQSAARTGLAMQSADQFTGIRLLRELPVK